MHQIYKNYYIPDSKKLAIISGAGLRGPWLKAGTLQRRSFHGQPFIDTEEKKVRIVLTLPSEENHEQR